MLHRPGGFRRFTFGAAIALVAVFGWTPRPCVAAGPGRDDRYFIIGRAIEGNAPREEGEVLLSRTVGADGAVACEQMLLRFRDGFRASLSLWPHPGVWPTRGAIADIGKGEWFEFREGVTSRSPAGTHEWDRTVLRTSLAPQRTVGLGRLTGAEHSFVVSLIQRVRVHVGGPMPAFAPVRGPADFLADWFAKLAAPWSEQLRIEERPLRPGSDAAGRAAEMQRSLGRRPGWASFDPCAPPAR